MACQWRAWRQVVTPAQLATIDVLSTFCLAAAGRWRRRVRLVGRRERTRANERRALAAAAMLDTAHKTHRHRGHRVAYLSLSQLVGQLP